MVTAFPGASETGAVSVVLERLMPGDNYQLIDTAGWYTIKHTFKNVNNLLISKIQLLDSTGAVVFTGSTVDDKTDRDMINSVGGNRYGWFSDLNVPTTLAIDNVSRTIDTNKFSVDQDATAPTSISLDDNQTVTLFTDTNDTVSTPVELTVTNPSNGAKVVIPAGTEVTAEDSTWIGTLNAPVVQAVSTVTINGNPETPTFSVKVGSDTPLSFSNPV